MHLSSLQKLFSQQLVCSALVHSPHAIWTNQSLLLFGEVGGHKCTQQLTFVVSVFYHIFGGLPDAQVDENKQTNATIPHQIHRISISHMQSRLFA